MVVVRAQKIPQKESDPADLIALFCFHYQQYTFAEARKLPYTRIRHMLNIAKKEYARKMRDLTVIVSAPHSKGNQVKVLLDRFNAIINE